MLHYVYKATLLRGNKVKSKVFSEQFWNLREQESPEQIIGIKCSLIFLPLFDFFIKMVMLMIVSSALKLLHAIIWIDLDYGIVCRCSEANVALVSANAELISFWVFLKANKYTKKTQITLSNTVSFLFPNWKKAAPENISGK